MGVNTNRIYGLTLVHTSFQSSPFSLSVVMPCTMLAGVMFRDSNLKLRWMLIVRQRRCVLFRFFSIHDYLLPSQPIRN